MFAFVARRFNVSKAFVGFDELHGINRDSRSLRAGRSNADALADGINALQASFARHAGADARLMVWADMLNYWHNGGRPPYQQQSASHAFCGTSW